MGISRLAIGIVGFSILFIISSGIWAWQGVNAYKPNVERSMPLLIFDSQEKYLPTWVNFDNDWEAWNNREHYVEDSPKGARIHTVKYDNFVVVQYWYYYVRNTAVNYHEHDEEHINVYLRNEKPFLMSVGAHGEREIHKVDSVDLWTYVGRGSHGMSQNQFNPAILPCDATGERLDYYELRPIEEEFEHGRTLTENEWYRTNEPGDLIALPWSKHRGEEEFKNPAKEIENTRYEQELRVEAVPLSVTASLPSGQEIVINGTLFFIIAGLIGVMFKRIGWVSVSILSALVVLAVIIQSLLTYPEIMLPLSAQVNTLRMVPYSLLTTIFATIGFAGRQLWERGIKTGLFPRIGVGVMVSLGVSTLLGLIDWTWALGIILTITILWEMTKI